MPPLSHPEPLIPEHSAHQRLRSDSIDLACSAGPSSFLGRLWPNRRKFAPSYKSASVGAAQEICELTSTPSKFTALKSQWSSSILLHRINYDNVHCNGESSTEDCADAKLRDLQDLQVLTHKSDFHGEGSHCKEASPEWVNLEGCNVECGNEACTNLPVSPILRPVEVNTENREEGSEERPQSQEVCVTPIMESLKGVVINKQGMCNGAGAPHAYGLKQGSKGIEGSNVSGAKKEAGDPKEGADQMLVKRLASFKAGEVKGIKKMRMSTLCELQRVAATVQWGNSLEERWLAADELRRLCKDDPIARVTLGVQLGAIPSLISLLHSAHRKHQCTALLALLNLAAGNDVNKGAIVKGKVVPRMVGLLQSAHTEVQTIIVTLFLSLSALDGNKAEIGTSGAVVLLVTLMHAPHIKKDALRTLYNLSIHPDNAKFIVEAGGVRILLDMVSDIDMGDKCLATLGNLVQAEAGRHIFANHKDVSYGVLIEAMRRSEMPKCQERAVYVLMMIARHSQRQREAMVAAGIIPALLELSLLGSPLAQKRATRTLDSFRRAKAVSAPQQRESLPFVASSTVSQQSTAETISEKKVVDGLVRQSLHRTMHRISRRAHLSSILGDPEGSESLPETTIWSLGRPAEQKSSSRSVSY